MIIDAFPFFNELDILEIRLIELAPVVDRFLLVEARQTYSGKPKPLYFERNKDRFASYPIEHVVIDQFPEHLEGSWQRENYPRHLMRDCLCGMDLAPGDLVLLSDVDEVPKRETVARCAKTLLREVPETVYVFNQRLSYYYVNCLVQELWLGTRMARWHDISDMQALRQSVGVVIVDGGWHFSYAGGRERIQEKLSAAAHTELDRLDFTDAEHIDLCMNEGRDLFGRDLALCFVPLDDSFPVALRQDPECYLHLVRSIPGEQLAQDLYRRAISTPSDVSEHLPYLYRLASTVEHVTELGTRTGQSTSAFVYAAPKRIVAYDLMRGPAVETLARAAKGNGVDFVFHECDVLGVEIEETDLLFIDTWHVEGQMREELRLHASQVRRYIVLHDTQTYGMRGETAGHAGVWPAVDEFLRHHPEWRILKHFPHNNGLTVLSRSGMSQSVGADA